MSHESAPDEIAIALQRVLGDELHIERMVGQGGFGRVYRAHDRRLDRPIAIKVLPPDLAWSAGHVERFQREGVALAKLRHPGVVPIYDIRQQDEFTFLIMPFIEGETLRGRLARTGRVAPKEAHRILLELCDALGAAHAAGIIHRDIKPDNVILEGALRKVLLMDFGISVSRDTSYVDEEGIALGTPLYMSPEQIAGDTALDARSDIYSLGALAYHLCTGVPPFSAATPVAVMAMHLHEPFVPLRHRNPSVPGEMADLIERCLAKSPEMRPASVHDVARGLHRVEFAVVAERVDLSPPLLTPLSAVFGVAALGAIAGSSIGLEWATALEAGGWWSFLALGCGALAALSSPLIRYEIRERLGGQPSAPPPLSAPHEPEVTESDPALQRTVATLFDALPSELRERFADVPDHVHRLEGAILLLRARLHAVGPAPDAAVEKSQIESRLDAATEALQLLRADLLRLTVGALTPGELTEAIDGARAVNADIDRLLAAEREVEAAILGDARRRVSEAQVRVEE